MHLIGVGEILWDVVGGAEHLGGAGFNFCTHLARLGHRVSFVSAVGDDDRGRRALAQARALGLSTRFIRASAGHPTGIVTADVDRGGQPSYIIHRPAAYDFAALDGADFAALSAPAPDWIAYGTLHFVHPGARQLLQQVLDRFPRARRFYDVNLRRDCYTTELVTSLLERAQVVKLNDAEVTAVAGMLGVPEAIEDFCRSSAARFGWQGVCVTRGSAGCALLLGGEYFEVPGYRVTVADTIGAGDAFSAAFVHGMQAGWPPREVCDFANRLGALVASRTGGVPAWTPEELQALAGQRQT